MQTLSSATDDDTTVAPWLAVLSVGIGAFALVTSEFLPVGLLPAMAAELAISKGQAGLMITTPGIVAAFAALFVTVGSGRLDRRIVLLALTALLVSNLLVALAPSYGAILPGRAMLGAGGFGFGAMPIAGQTWMCKAAPHLMEGSSAPFVAIVQVSLASDALLGGMAVDRLGVSSAMVLGGVFALGGALTIALFGKPQASAKTGAGAACEA